MIKINDKLVLQYNDKTQMDVHQYVTLTHVKFVGNVQGNVICLVEGRMDNNEEMRHL